VRSGAHERVSDEVVAAARDDGPDGEVGNGSRHWVVNDARIAAMPENAAPRGAGRRLVGQLVEHVEVLLVPDLGPEPRGDLRVGSLINARYAGRDVPSSGGS
jgi:hypothetical protein